MDMISNLPDGLISLILEKLPLIDTVKTSTLSKNWRFKWTFLSSLRANSQFHRSVSGEIKPLEYASIVNSLLFQHRGVLRELILYIPNAANNHNVPSCLLFQHSIGYVVRCHTLERLILFADYEHASTLPSSIFSAVNLRHLKVGSFKFFLPSWFEGFPKLTHFVLRGSETRIDTLSRFAHGCPLLEEIQLYNSIFVGHDQFVPFLDLNAPKLTHLSVTRTLVDVVVSNAEHLESISMYFDYLFENLDDEDVSEFTDMFKMYKYATLLQHVSFDEDFLKCLGHSEVIHTLPRFDQMKSVRFNFVTLDNINVLQSLLSFCAASPNVQKIRIQTYRHAETVDTLKLELMVEKYINADFEHLVRVDLLFMDGTGVKMKMIELLLRFSPVLEVMHLQFCSKENLPKLQKDIAKFRKASPKARIEFT